MNLLSLLLSTVSTHAQTYNGGTAIGLVGGGFTSFAGIPALDGIINGIFASSTPLVYSIAILMVAISGVEMIASQSDDSASKATRTFISAVAGLILLVLAQVIRNAVINVGINGGAATGSILSDEIIGVVDFLTAVVGVLVVLMLIVNGIRAIVQFGGGDGIGILRSTILNVIFGVIVISIRWAVVDSVYISNNASILVDTVIAYINTGLMFIGTIAVLVIIYAGIMMIANSGNDDQLSKSRGIIIRALIGIAIILLSGAIVNAIFAGV
jgi:hypothetical protein